MLTYGSELLKKTASEGFWRGYFAIADPFERLFYSRDSTQETETEAWLGAPSMPAEWTGDLQPEVVPELSQTIQNKHWARPVRVDKKLEKFQQWNAISDLTGLIGMKTRAHRIKRLTTILEAGFTTGGECYDGQYYFDDDHVDPSAAYSTSQDNDLTSAITNKDAPTAAEAAASIRSCVDAALGFKDSAGDPFMSMTSWPGNSSDWIVMVPTGYASAFRKVLIADTVSAAGDNDLKGTFTLVINQYLTNTDYFYLFYAGHPHKPFVSQMAGGVELIDEKETYTGHYLYNGSYWGNVQYGDWRCAVAMIHTTA